jgi:hypothetical protein
METSRMREIIIVDSDILIDASRGEANAISYLEELDEIM